MPLVQCPDCGKSVSTSAPTCPNCGRPMAAVVVAPMPFPPAPTHGGTGNVVAGVASFFIPGLGQLVQGRWIAGAIHFGAACLLWPFMFGWVIHVLSALGAATWRPR